MSIDAATILRHLAAVGAERSRRAADPGLGAAVQQVKRYQQARFSHTYADLLASPRYRPAAQFFLDELYGPRDFSQRDSQFERVVPALVRLFPLPIVGTVATLAGLHALSEQLDSAMAGRLAAGAVLDTESYARAWQASATPAERERQIALTLEVGRSLDRLTRNLLVRNSLRLMRGPARAAGLGELQSFLESGFEAFRRMHGAQEFLGLVEAREQRLNRALFDAAPTTDPEALARLLPGSPAAA
ncbi:MAG: hypothetical protein ABIX46_01085 [Burkholderiaceae bacterium]